MNRQTSISVAQSTVEHLAIKGDPDRWLGARLAPPPARARLAALYAFNSEVAKTAEIVSDPMIGEIRLAWWREGVETLYHAPEKARQHDVTLALQAALDTCPQRPPLSLFETLLEARRKDLDETPPTTLDDWARYCEATSGVLAELALCACDGTTTTDARRAARTLGAVWGMVGLLRALPARANAARWCAPLDVIRAAGVKGSALTVDSPAEHWLSVRAALLTYAREAYGAAAPLARDIPRPGLPAIAYVRAVRGILKDAQRSLMDSPASERREKPLAKQGAVFLASVTGKV